MWPCPLDKLDSESRVLAPAQRCSFFKIVRLFNEPCNCNSISYTNVSAFGCNINAKSRAKIIQNIPSKKGTWAFIFLTLPDVSRNLLGLNFLGSVQCFWSKLDEYIFKSKMVSFGMSYPQTLTSCKTWCGEPNGAENNEATAIISHSLLYLFAWLYSS